jgi:hypothetical protein
VVSLTLFLSESWQCTFSRFYCRVRTTLVGHSTEKRSTDSKKDLAADFEGVTAYLQAPAEGLWREGGQTDNDDIVIFEVMTEEIDLQDWRRRRSELERRFRQDKVIIRYMPVVLV